MEYSSQKIKEKHVIRNSKKKKNPESNIMFRKKINRLDSTLKHLKSECVEREKVGGGGG